LRSQLEPPGAVAGSVIIADKLVVELNPEAFTTDVQEFEDGLRAAARAGGDEERQAALARAVDACCGPLLPGYYEEWVAGEQERLSERFQNACHELAALLAKGRRLREALQIARRGASADPLRESAQRDIMRLLAATGQAAAALRQYREFERRLAEELSDEPSAPTRQLARQIESQAEPTVAAATPDRPAAPRVRRAASSDTTPAPPSGTVTFLLTDIEGSTALWERAGDAFREALARHHALLRHEFRRAGGHEVKEAGDSFLVAFASASDALACAVACQRALAAQEWPESVGALRVRTLIHTGDVTHEGGDYHGLPLHRASRMLHAGHGRQILCSEATTGLLRRDLESEVSLLDLGVYRLRDVDEPERLFQVDYPGMPRREFPALRAERGYAGRLPLQLTRFFGREKEIERIERLLKQDGARIVTLTGPGGTGKTRLAIEAAGRLLDHFDGAVWFVAAADLSDASVLPDAIHDAMRLPRSGGGDPLAEVVEALSHQPALLILDNLEQVVDGGAEAVRELAARLPSLAVIATSRQVLGVDGEREFVVDPLPVPSGPVSAERLGLYESVRLFVDRAQAVKPDFQVTNGNAPAVAELCVRLEGIPLAIELAAARASVLSPTQMLYQLGNRFEFLVSRRRGVAERQRTLRAAVDWSYRLLSPDLQRFFARLSVFRGGCTVESAESVCEEPLALDALAQLRESSLVLTETCPTCGRMRFRLLETLREYAWGRLSAEEQSEIERRHAAHFDELAEQAEPYLTGPDQATWLAHLDAEHDNLRAALGWADRSGEAEMRLRLAGSLWRFWSVRGYFAQGRRALEDALAGTD
ncbi:MAG TPA: BTAD domain-containing putative transcriptional regulator, partial [Solirubrobacterales bacterium]